MDFNKKSEEIRWSIALIKDKSISKSLKENKLGRIADICDIKKPFKTDFVKTSLKMQKNNEQIKWTRYLESVLIQAEQYELLHLLKL